MRIRYVQGFACMRRVRWLVRRWRLECSPDAADVLWGKVSRALRTYLRT